MVCLHYHRVAFLLLIFNWSIIAVQCFVGFFSFFFFFNPHPCWFLLYNSVDQLWVYIYVSVSHSVVPNSLRPHGLQPTRLLFPWHFPGKDTGVECHFLLQGIFPTQESNPGLLHSRFFTEWATREAPCIHTSPPF